MKYELIVIGGGAAGFFGAIQTAISFPGAQILILEKSTSFLSKVKISGGGRCNVTHSAYDPKQLVLNYPRGSKELLGPFYEYGVQQLVDFFSNRGVAIKTEEDGRMFPVSDSSQSIIDCFMSEAELHGIVLKTRCAVTDLQYQDETNSWMVHTKEEIFKSHCVLWATGSSPIAWKMLERLGHQLVLPVPSLFSFNIHDEELQKLAGTSLETALKIYSKKENYSRMLLEERGATLITHWGLSGPAILRSSAWGALLLYEQDYNFILEVNWLPTYSKEEVMDRLLTLKNQNTKKAIKNVHLTEIPARLWLYLLHKTKIPLDKRWADLNKKEINGLCQQLIADRHPVEGKSTYKDEFVTAGGVELKEVNFKTLESKLYPHLFFAGEVLNIDAITGGFNFQNAWTGAYIAAQAITDRIRSLS